MTEVFGMGNGLLAYVRQRLVDYATARWILAGAVPSAVAGALLAHHVSPSLLRVVFGSGLLVLSGFLVLVRSPEECEPGEGALDVIDRKSENRGETVIEARDGSVLEKILGIVFGLVAVLVLGIEVLR